MSVYLVAVIIPTLNEEVFIERCINSIIHQTYSFEQIDLMVVDGGSKDKTAEIVLKLSCQFPNIRLIHNSHKIQSVAFNIGVENSTAPFVVRLDAHALYEPHYIERCVKELEKNCYRGNVGGRWNIIAQHPTLWAEANAILNYSKFGIGGASFRVGAKAGNVDTVPFGAFPRSVIEQIGGMREDLPRGEDNEYNSRIRKAGYEIYFDPEIVCTYYARSTLMASAKQMFANGKSIGHLLYVDKSSIAVRHLVPLIFVLGIVLGIVGSAVWTPTLYALIICLCAYFICDIAASFVAATRNGWKFFFPLFILFFTVHISYGFGTAKGLFRAY